MVGDNEEPISPGGSENQAFDAAPAPDAPADTPADSSPADDGDSRRDLLSVVRDAVKSGDPASPAKQEGGNPPVSGESPAKPESREQDDEGFSDVPFHNHPRFRQLVQQRNQYRQAAQEYGKFTSFLDANGVKPQEAAEHLKLVALAKTDPAAAWKQLRPFAKQLLELSGEAMPADLQQQVRAGKLTRDAAMEISRLRAQNASTQRAQEFQREREARERSTKAQQAIVSAVASVERELVSRDPDFSAKAQEIQKEILWMQRQHAAEKRGPLTPEIAAQMTREAHAAVTKRMAPQSRPAPGRDQQGRFQPTNVSGGRVASGQPPASPKSILDVVRGARAAG